jgi:glutamine amidotransferase
VADAAEAEAADGVVLPGVGAFGRCAEALIDSGLDKVARNALETGVPFLGICVGFQLLYEGSEESPGTPGLGALAGTVQRLPAGVKCPQIQWNPLRAVGDRPSPIGPETVATCDYGGDIAAAIERDHIWGTQFHPEKSGAFGLAVLANFVELATARGAAQRI